MKHRILTAVCMALCLATSAQVMAGLDLPAMDLWVIRHRRRRLTKWPSPFPGPGRTRACPSRSPSQSSPATASGSTFWSPVGTSPTTAAGVVYADPTPFEVRGIAGYMAAGYYDVYARIISCEGRGSTRPSPVSGHRRQAGRTGLHRMPGLSLRGRQSRRPAGRRSARRFRFEGRTCWNGHLPGLPHGLRPSPRQLGSLDGRRQGYRRLRRGSSSGLSCHVRNVVDLGKVEIGRPFNRIGRVYRGLEGCLTFVADNGLRFNILATGNMYRILDELAHMSTGNRVRLQGLLNDTCPKSDSIRICPQYAGDIYHPIVSECRDVPDSGSGACDMDLQPGDRVELLVDRPMGAGGGPAVDLYAGAMGTVICTDSTDDDLPFYVSWDDWLNGTDTDYFCDSAVVPYIPGSGWWMRAMKSAWSITSVRRLIRAA